MSRPACWSQFGSMSHPGIMTPYAIKYSNIRNQSHYGIFSQIGMRSKMDSQRCAILDSGFLTQGKELRCRPFKIVTIQGFQNTMQTILEIRCRPRNSYDAGLNQVTMQAFLKVPCDPLSNKCSNSCDILQETP